MDDGFSGALPAQLVEVTASPVDMEAYPPAEETTLDGGVEYEDMDPLEEDILQQMREDERMMPIISLDKTYISFRGVLTEYISAVGYKDLQLSPITVHLATRYIDLIINRVRVARLKLQLVALCCLQIAVKMNEVEAKVPTLQKLSELSNCAFRPQEFGEMEMHVLQQLQWRLKVLTPIHFFDFFLQYALQADDCQDGQPIPEMAYTYSLLKKYSSFFMEFALQGYIYTQHLPSMVAAAAISAARRALRITPEVPEGIEDLSGYSFADLAPVIEPLWRSYQDFLAGAVVAPVSETCVPTAMSVEDVARSPESVNSRAAAVEFVRVSPVR